MPVIRLFKKKGPRKQTPKGDTTQSHRTPSNIVTCDGIDSEHHWRLEDGNRDSELYTEPPMRGAH